MFGNKNEQRAHLLGDDAEIGRYLEEAVRAAQETLTRGAFLIADDELTLEDVLTVGPDIMCADADLPAGVVTWARREAAYRTAVAYACENDQRIMRGDDDAIQATIDDLSRQPREVQAGFLNIAALLP